MSRYGTDTKIICLFLLQLCDLITPFRGCLCFCLFKFLILAVLDLVFLRPRRLFPCKDDDPAKIALAMQISKKTLRIVHQNIVFALAVKFICLGFGAIGYVNMWWAIFADVGVMILAVLNATRALRVEK